MRTDAWNTFARFLLSRDRKEAEGYAHAPLRSRLSIPPAGDQAAVSGPAGVGACSR